MPRSIELRPQGAHPGAPTSGRPSLPTSRQSQATRSTSSPHKRADPHILPKASLDPQIVPKASLLSDDAWPRSRAVKREPMCARNARARAHGRLGRDPGLTEAHWPESSCLHTSSSNLARRGARCAQRHGESSPLPGSLFDTPQCAPRHCCRTRHRRTCVDRLTNQTRRALV